MNSDKLNQIAGLLVGVAVMIPMVKLSAEPLPGLSESVFTIGKDSIDCTVGIAWQDLNELMLLDENDNGALDERELRSWKEDLSALAEVFFEVYHGDDPLEADSVLVSQLDGSSGAIVFKMHYPASAIADWDHVDVAFESLEDFPEGHQHQLSVQTSAGVNLHRELFGDQLTQSSKIPLANPRTRAIQAAPIAAAPPEIASTDIDQVSGSFFAVVAIVMIGVAASLYALFFRRNSAPPQDRC